MFAAPRRLGFWQVASLFLAIIAAGPPTTTCVCAGEVSAREADALRAALESIDTKQLKKHAALLADDTFEGREAGSRGGQASGLYIARELRRLKLAGGAKESYVQPFGAGYRNVLGLLEGSDAKLKDEVIVVGAHYDHVGYGTPQNSFGPVGRIHNGADDNASGTAGLLETVEAFAEHAPRPRRTILFAFWDAEEKGLLGSLHWLRNPTLALSRVKMAVNSDMIGRLRDRRLEIYGVRTGPGLRRLVSLQNTESLSLDFFWAMRADSDHHPFFDSGIPSIMFHTGLHDDYHRPSDDSEKLNVEGIQQASRMLFRLAFDLANRDELPAFRSASRRESDAERQTSEQAVAYRGRLGATWETAATSQKGLRIFDVVRGSAAERAGLRRGDRVIEFAGQPISDFDAIRRLSLVSASPATALIERDGDGGPRRVNVELDGPPVKVGVTWRVDDAEPNCVILSQVIPGTPAEKAGLVVNDRVYSVGGKTFSTADEFRALVNEAPGDVVLQIERQGGLREVTLPRTSGDAKAE
ncbi:MAG: M20/M25/M40 family metallo-hydrolase [Planctomycetia bacterium]|nr:M20/M25/M40 family metallo-hydrolase [Planctomycetia bacterium]